jgi:hypothetical protein
MLSLTQCYLSPNVISHPMLSLTRCYLSPDVIIYLPSLLARRVRADDFSLRRLCTHRGGGRAGGHGMRHDVA